MRTLCYLLELRLLHLLAHIFIHALLGQHRQCMSSKLVAAMMGQCTHRVMCMFAVADEPTVADS